MSSYNENELADILTAAGASEHLQALKALGLWTHKAHRGAAEVALRRELPETFADADDDRISNLNAYWASESARAAELAGVLEGAKTSLSIKLKSRLAAARHRARANRTDKPTAAEIADAAELDPAVREAQNALATIEAAAAGARAYKEACLTLLGSVSREISFRQAHYAARIRG